VRIVWIALVLFSAGVRAEPSAYVEVALNAVPQRVDEQRFTLGEAEFRAGVYVADLIAIEAYSGAGVISGSEKGMEQSLNSLYGAGLRLESPDRDDTKAFVLLGYSASELELTRKSSGETLANETFDGLSYGLGFEHRLSSGWPLYINARWQRHYAAGEIDIDAAGVALRYVF